MLYLTVSKAGSDNAISAITHGANLSLQQLTFASLYALCPCVIKICISSISTVLKPSTAASAAATFAKCFSDAALGAGGTNCR